MSVFSTFKLELLESGGSNQKVANIIDDQDPKPFCRHPLENITFFFSLKKVSCYEIYILKKVRLYDIYLFLYFNPFFRFKAEVVLKADTTVGGTLDGVDIVALAEDIVLAGQTTVVSPSLSISGW